MDKNTATEIQKLALEAVERLMDVLHDHGRNCEAYETQQITRGVGLAIGTIETELLGFIYSKYPDLDDLRDVEVPKLPDES